MTIEGFIIIIFLILRVISQHRLGLKNLPKPSKILYRNMGELKIYWKGILEGLEKFFKPFSSLYSNLKIKNILIINILFSFSTKLPSQIRWEISLFLSPPPPTAIPFPPLQTPKQSKKLKNSHDLLSCICNLS